MRRWLRGLPPPPADTRPRVGGGQGRVAKDELRNLGPTGEKLVPWAGGVDDNDVALSVYAATENSLARAKHPKFVTPKNCRRRKSGPCARGALKDGLAGPDDPPGLPGALAMPDDGFP